MNARDAVHSHIGTREECLRQAPPRLLPAGPLRLTYKIENIAMLIHPSGLSPSNVGLDPASYASMILPNNCSAH